MVASFDWLRAAMGYGGGLAAVVKPGDLVQHRNGGQWALVLRVVPQHDGTAELEIEGIVRPECQWDSPSIRWWATYHIRDYVPCYGPIQARSPKKTLTASEQFDSAEMTEPDQTLRSTVRTATWATLDEAANDLAKKDGPI